MKTIEEDIKNKKFQTCYLLYGEEAYLKKQYKDKLVSAMAQKGDTLNFSAYEGKDANPAKLIDLAETMPFLAERRVILVEESCFFKNACDILADYLPVMNQSACFIFVESEVDKRSRMYKAVGKSGRAVEFAVPSEALILKWMRRRAADAGKDMPDGILQLFLQKTGLDMSRIDRELEKLLCFAMKKDAIEASDVEAIVAEQAENKVFEMADAVLSHNRKRALLLYDDLLELREAPMRILFLLARQLRILLEVGEMAGKGYGSAEMAKRAGVPGFALRKYQAQAKKFSEKRLKDALFDCADLEERAKTGLLNEKMAVEIFIVKYSSDMDVS